MMTPNKEESMMRCKRTISGKHIFSKSMKYYTGEMKQRYEDVSPIMHQKDMQLVDYEVSIDLPKCVACGLIDDTPLLGLDKYKKPVEPKNIIHRSELTKHIKITRLPGLACPRCKNETWVKTNQSLKGYCYACAYDGESLVIKD